MKFFHWHCPVCDLFGGLQLPADTPSIEVLNAAQEHHDVVSYPSEVGDVPCRYGKVEIEP